MNTTATPLWSPLLPAALVGTARQALPSLSAPGQAGQLLQAIRQAGPDTEAAEQLLRQAAVLAVCQRAAACGQAPGTALPPAAPDTRPSLSDDSLTPHLRWLLQEGDEARARLLHEALQLLHARGWRLPASLLPAALDAGRRRSALRPALLPVLGTRGQWLAAQSPHWHYAAPAQPAPAQAATDDSTADNTNHDWHTGTLVQRQAWLHAARQSQPAAAREALASALPDLPAAERAALLPLLAQGLSMEDEALLTQLLQDRSRDVRHTAARLLTALPDSAHAQAMCQRMAALLPAPAADAPAAGGLLSRTIGTLGTLGKAVGLAGGNTHGLKPDSLQAPDAPQPDWKASLIEADRPKHESLGERAWWLYQIVRQTPLAWWHAHTGAEPQALLQWAQQTDWTEALSRGWLDALRASAAVQPLAPDTATLVQAWALAFLHSPQPGRHVQAAGSELLALLPQAERESLWMLQLQAFLSGLQNPRARKSPSPDDLRALLEQMHNTYPPGQHLSEPLAQTLLNTFSQLLQAKALDQDWAVHLYLPYLPCLLPEPLLPALQQLPRLGDEPNGLRKTLDNCQHIARARQAVLQMPQAPA